MPLSLQVLTKDVTTVTHCHGLEELSKNGTQNRLVDVRLGSGDTVLDLAAADDVSRREAYGVAGAGGFAGGHDHLKEASCLFGLDGEFCFSFECLGEIDVEL